MRIEETMTRNVYTISSGDSLESAWEIMREANIRHLPVVEDEALIGLLSERDVLLRASYDEDEGVTIPDLTVYDVMVTEITSCSADTSVSEAVTTMTENKIDCLPVVAEGNKLVGLITSTDIMQLVYKWDDGSSNKTLPFKFHVVDTAKIDKSTDARPWT